MKNVLPYNEKFKDIPKDYMERLSYLFRICPYTKDDLNELLEKIDVLMDGLWESVTYIFYMIPIPASRPKLNTKTFTFYVKDAKNIKDVFDMFKRESSGMDCVISTPSRLTAKVYMETPKGMNIQEKIACELELIHHINSPDWDNLGKQYCDVVQKVLISNDSIVCRGMVEKFYSVLPRVEVRLDYMTAYDCKYNKRTVENRKSFKENPLTVKNVDYII